MHGSQIHKSPTASQLRLITLLWKATFGQNACKIAHALQIFETF